MLAARRLAPAPRQPSWGHKLPRKPGLGTTARSLSGGWWPEWTASYHKSSRKEETLQAPHSSTDFCAACPWETGTGSYPQPHLTGGWERRITSTSHSQQLSRKDRCPNSSPVFLMYLNSRSKKIFGLSTVSTIFVKYFKMEIKDMYKLLK